MFQNGPAKVIIHEMMERIEELEALLEKYPNLHVEQTWDGERFFTVDVNKTVDQFEKVSAEGYEFFIQNGERKIYADPPGANTETDEGYEFDWLPEIAQDEINPAVLVKLMRHINSKYVNDSYYHKKLPYLKEWFSKY